MALGTTLLAFERIPNERAMEMAPTAGWIMLFCAVCAAAILISNHEGWRRLWLRAEDPRTMAAFRIVLGLCTMANINGMWELYTYLFTDEGLFLTDVARQVFARQQFEGFGNGLDGDPYGFFGFDAILEFLSGPKYSLLFFWDSPTAFWIHWAAFQVAIVCFIVGFKTRYTKWIAWFLFHSIARRNTVYWEGTENVFRCFLFYLCVSRCAHAYSVDNWLRCRRLRRQGLLSEPGKPGNGAGAPPSEEHPKGLEAIYRLIPAWPRLLVILQCGALYCYTGVVKNGSVWWRGDSFYYALNLDHFYRFPPQQLSAIFGTTLFRLNAHVVHAWECLFPLVIFGLMVRFGLRERLPALTGRARLIHRLAWVGLGLGALTLCIYLYEVHLKLPKETWWTLQKVRIGFGTAWLLGMGLVAALSYRLRYRPWRVTLRGKERVLDLDWFLRWTMGRRVWVFLGVAFHTHVFIMMNIGWFQPGSTSGFIAFVNGGELALIFNLIARRFGKKTDPLPAEDPTLPHLRRDSVRLPTWSMWVAAAMATAGVFVAYLRVIEWEGFVLSGDVALKPWGFGWTLIGIAAFLGGVMLRAALDARQSQLADAEIVPLSHRRPDSEDADQQLTRGQLTAPWAYGPFGRFFINCLVVYHIVGVACWLLPDKDSFRWRTKTHDPFRNWLELTQTTQGWKMFAPNPPRSNLFLRVIVTDGDGNPWDMNTDVYADENRPLPWIWYTRQRKINRRIAGGEGGKGSWYQKWHARWYCRKWQLEHDGEMAQKVELVKITYRIPTPEQVAKSGPYDPVERLEETSKQTSIYTAKCATEIGAQVPAIILERHGIEPPEQKVRRWNMLRNKKKRWDRKKEKEKEAEANQGKTPAKD